MLVADVEYPLQAAARLRRDRADAENAFDELKNPWGLSGFTTQELNRCQTVARACALVYNGCSWCSGRRVARSQAFQADGQA